MLRISPAPAVSEARAWHATRRTCRTAPTTPNRQQRPQVTTVSTNPAGLANMGRHATRPYGPTTTTYAHNELRKNRKNRTWNHDAGLRTTPMA